MQATKHYRQRRRNLAVSVPVAQPADELHLAVRNSSIAKRFVADAASFGSDAASIRYDYLVQREAMPLGQQSPTADGCARLKRDHSKLGFVERKCG